MAATEDRHYDWETVIPIGRAGTMNITRRRALAAGAVAPLAAGMARGPVAAAQQATPATSPAAGVATPVGGAAGASVDVVVTGLVNPRGFTSLPDGRMVIAEAGSGGPTARVVAVEADGSLTELLGGFPTARVYFRGISGFADVKLGPSDELYALLAGGDINRDFARNGLYRLDGAGGAELVADISAFIRDNPVAAVPGDYDDDGQPYRLLPMPEQDGFLVTEGNSCQVLRVGLDGTVSRVADLSVDNWIPTGLARIDDGPLHVAAFTAAPFAPGSARVLAVGDDGALEVAYGNLTMVTDLVAFDGGLWALEMASGYDVESGAPVASSGRLVYLPPGQPDAQPLAVVEGLHLPGAMRAGIMSIDGRELATFFISGPTLGADDGSGTVIRVTLPG